MNPEDVAFLRAITAAPDEAAPRLIYADWLDERGDSRAELLRSDWNLTRLSFVDWVASEGSLDYYLMKFPELRSRRSECEANRWWREKSRPLASDADRQWLAVIDSLGRPFRPFYFWCNGGPRAFQDGQLPFREPIGTRGPLVCFASSFRGDAAWQPSLAEDLAFLQSLELADCEYGAASCPTQRFACDLAPGSLTSRGILDALRVADFRTDPMPDLDAASIPTWQPNRGYYGDRIHNDPEAQCLLPRPEDLAASAYDAEGLIERDAVHQSLRRAVAGGQLWYVLLHGPCATGDGRNRPGYVVLFAVGRSVRGDRLIGVVSNQVCHNLCD